MFRHHTTDKVVGGRDLCQRAGKSLFSEPLCRSDREDSQALGRFCRVANNCLSGTIDRLELILVVMVVREEEFEMS